VRITRLRIQNFRSIKDLTIDLGETTVFIGQNNAGKTAIIDAVRIVLTRRWGKRGTGFTENDVHRPDPNCDPRILPPVMITLMMEESRANEVLRASGLQAGKRTFPVTTAKAMPHRPGRPWKSAACRMMRTPPF
jgi:predicted ATP-dependent endonuclease of OLD family